MKMAERCGSAEIIGWRPPALETIYVCDWCMSKARTNIETEDAHVRVIMDNRYGVSTKTEAVDLALRHLASSPAMSIWTGWPA